MPSTAKIALVHDFFITMGGAEQVYKALHELPVASHTYTAITYPELLPKGVTGNEITSSFLSSMPGIRSLLPLYKLFLPLAFSSLHFASDEKVIVSDTASFAKYVVPPPGTVHISYIHTPPRFLWNLEPSMKIRKNMFLRFLFNVIVGTYFRISDYQAATRVHVLVANSEETRRRIKKVYRRDAMVIYPPVEVNSIHEQTNNIPQKSDGYLYLGRLENYKQIKELITLWPAEEKLTIIGSGSLEKELKAMIAGKPSITLLGYVSDQEKIEALRTHAALIYPNRDDFGIGIVEALAAGTPVISLAQGGALEIVKHQNTGYLMQQLDQTELLSALTWTKKYIKSSETAEYLYQSVVQFDGESFKKQMTALIEQYLVE